MVSDGTRDIREEIRWIRKASADAATAAKWTAFGVFLAVALGGWAFFARGAYTTEKWAYDVQSFDDDEWDNYRADAGKNNPNAWGREGWEIVAARRAGSGSGMTYECILKKRVR